MFKDKTICAIVQARMTSSRLPGKALLPLSGEPVLKHIIQRLRRSIFVDDVIIACTTNEQDNPIIELCESMSCKYFRGSEEDVLTRVLGASEGYDIIVEITADCPCIDKQIIDCLIPRLVIFNYDYVSNVIDRTYPRGLDTQVFWRKTLERVNEEVDNPIDRQHVSTWIYRNPKTKGFYSLYNHKLKKDYSNYRITLDTKEDYELLSKIFDNFNDNKFDLYDIINLLELFPNLTKTNQMIVQKSYEKELEEWYKKNTQH